MLLRAAGRSVSHLVAASRQRLAVRTIAVSRIACGGGHHHHEPTPVYIPKPGSLEWSLCGNPNAKRISEETEYKPAADDFVSFIGAFVFVGLTILAVAVKTDAFNSDKHAHSHSHTKPAKHQEEPVEARHEHKVEECHLEEKKAEDVPKLEEVISEDSAPVAEPSEPVASQPVAEEASSSKEVEAQPVEEPAKHESTSSEETAIPAAAPSNNEETPSTSSDEKSEAKESGETKEEQLRCEYVIIGSGTAAYYASLAIRAKHGDAKVLMIGEETELPYNRPPLSKELFWYGDEGSGEKLNYTGLSGKKRDIFYEVEGFYVKPEEIERAEHGGVSLIRGKKVQKICTQDRKVYLDDGSCIGYGKLLIATGSRPKKEKIFESAEPEAQEKITYYHYPADFKKVEKGLSDKSVKKVTIVGNGLLASELAYSIKRKYEEAEVHQVFEQQFNADDILPAHLAKKSTDALKSMGIQVHSREKITGIRKCCKNVVLTLKDGSDLRSDLIIVATGEEVNNEIAEASGIRIDEKTQGISADKTLKVDENVWVAGSVASFEDSVLGTRRLSTWENAQVTGRLAGENMAVDGEGKAFWYQPSFFTKFAPHMHINAIGNVDANLDTIAVYAEPSKETELEKAVVFYKGKQGEIVGVLLLNVFGPSLDVARRIIDDKKQFDDLKELAKLFPLYDPPKDEEEKKKKD
ncbi:unnamed protein product [Caenorhabditis bovis]|uniref:FAD/NAD(P)-binding domain-containing protein n=1 Tax=Caenorhabditis bovis TaxID=2654633 RepID=A0A8S1EVM0_9PELO|nr:unnamed protein product [Caenorhabditis bovis]